MGQKDPPEKEMATAPVFLPGEFHGQRKLVGYSPWGGKESDMTDRLTLALTKSLQTVTAAMKLEDACSLAEKL